MADQHQQQAQDTVKQSHAVAHQSLAAAANVVGKMHDSVMKAQAPDQKHQQLMDAISSLQMGGGGQPDQMQDNPQSSQDAVWSEFPGTDPNAIDHLVQSSGGDPQGVLGPLFHLFASDEQKLAAMHQQIIDHVLTMLSAPAGPPTDQAQPSPAVGGDYAGI